MKHRRGVLPAERVLFFTDAVVAIAMTLLIIPLLESVAEAAAKHEGAPEWLSTNSSGLASFVLSFVVIATFWMQHHSAFAGLVKATQALMWLNIVWMLAIVWLPVATAMVGSMDADHVQVVMYIGAMAVAAGTAVAAQALARRDPGLWEGGRLPAHNTLSVAIAVAVLYALALVLALVVPRINYTALFVLFLTNVVSAVLRRRFPGLRTTPEPQPDLLDADASPHTVGDAVDGLGDDRG